MLCIALGAVWPSPYGGSLLIVLFSLPVIPLALLVGLSARFGRRTAWRTALQWATYAAVAVALAMGAIGWISMDRRLEFSVAIRTAFLTEGRVRYYGGCGITADSVPSDEFAESRHKIRAFVRALGAESDPNW